MPGIRAQSLLILVILLAGPGGYWPHDVYGKHVPHSNAEDPPPRRMLRSLEGVVEKYKEMIANFRTVEGVDKSTEVATTFMYACLGLDERAKTMEVTIQTQGSKLKQLENENFNIKKELRNEISNNRQSELLISLRTLELRRRLSGYVNQMDANTLSTAKITLQVLRAYTEWKDLETKVSKEKNATVLNELREKMTAKKETFLQAEQELIAAGRSSKLVQEIVDLQDRIRELEGSSTEDLLSEVTALKEELKKKQLELENANSQDLTLVMQVMTSEDKILQIYTQMLALKQQSNVTISNLKNQLMEKRSQLQSLRQSPDSAGAAQIIDLEGQINEIEHQIDGQQKQVATQIKEFEKAIETKEETLTRTVGQLQQIQGTDYDLIVKVVTKQLQISGIQATLCSKQQDTEAVLTELKKELDNLRNENIQIKDKNKALERENYEYSGLQERYEELKKKADDLMKNMKDKDKFVTQINSLAIEIESLQRRIVQNPSNIAELEKLLAEKQAQLESLKKTNVPGSKQIVEIFETFVNLNNNTHDSAKKNLKRITDLQLEIDNLMDQLTNKTEENDHLIVQVITLQKSEVLLKKELAKLKEEYATKIRGLEEMVAKKDSQLKAEKSKCDKQDALIDKLTQDVSKSQTELSTYKESNRAKIAELTENLKRMEERLQNATDELKASRGANADQVLKIIQLQAEMAGIVSSAVTEKQVLHDTITDLKKQLASCSGENQKLHHTISELRTTERTLRSQCTSLNDTYWELRKDFDQTLTKVDATSQLILKMNMLIMDIERLQNSMAGMTGDTTAVEAEVQSKVDELENIEKQLGLKNRVDSKKIKNIMGLIVLKAKQMTEENNERYLQRINELESELNEKINELKGEESEKTKLLIQILSLEEDIESLQKRVSKTKAESSKRIKEIERMLEQKYKEINELKAKDCGVNAMKGKIDALESEAKKLELELTEAKKTAEDQIRELERRLTEKKSQLQINSEKLKNLDDTNGELVMKIIDLERNMKKVTSESQSSEATSEAKIKDLKEQLQEKDEENARLKITVTALEKSKKEVQDNCATLKQQYTDLKTKFDGDLEKVEGVQKLILQLSMMRREKAQLERQLESGTGDNDDLRKELEKKNSELKKIEEELERKSPSAVQIKELIAIIQNTAMVEAESNADYLKQIAELELELKEKIEALQGEEAEKIKATIAMMEQMEEISQLKDRLAKAKLESSKKVAVIEEKLAKKQQEINQLKAEDCGVGKRVEEIAALEREARNLEAELEKVKEASRKEIEELTKRLQKVNEDLSNNSKKQGEMMTEIITKNHEINKLLNDKKDVKEKNAEAISDLQNKLTLKEKENSELKAENEALKENKDGADKVCTDLKVKMEDLQNKLTLKEEENSKLKAENEEIKSELDTKDNIISALQKERIDMATANKVTKEAMEKLQNISDSLTLEKEQLEQTLSKVQEENEELRKKVKDSESKKPDAIDIIQPAIDPSTAHPKLKLSDQNREMRLQLNPDDVPDLPTRYHHLTAALASTGFDEGKHYWEVGVNEKKCYMIGVAGATAMRKENVKLHPRNQYWILVLARNGVLSAMDNKVVKVKDSQSTKPSVLGVLVDLIKREISFYDAGSKFHLYTFKDTDVKSKLFPFIGTCEDTDLGSPPIMFNPVASADWLGV